MLREPGMSTQALCDAFYNFLKDCGINSQRSSVVQSMAEKANVLIPGLYDEASLTDAK